jgi:hypothetical protein
MLTVPEAFQSMEHAARLKIVQTTVFKGIDAVPCIQLLPRDGKTKLKKNIVQTASNHSLPSLESSIIVVVVEISSAVIVQTMYLNRM